MTTSNNTVQEFHIGEVVTFCAYGHKIKAVVDNVREPHNNISHSNEVTYDLIAFYVRQSLKAQTSGRCIVESELFDENNLIA